MKEKQVRIQEQRNFLQATFPTKHIHVNINNPKKITYSDNQKTLESEDDF